ncbi:MAG: DUF3305 domain-containing protein [Beijerinckiaceae bacterium]
MPTLTMQVGLVLEKRKANSQWIDFIWEASSVLPEPAAAEAGTSLGKHGNSELFYAGEHTLEAHTYETPQYRDNLSSGAPKIWVILKPQDNDAMPEIVQVTCDPTEGEGYTETGWNTVNVVPMPEMVEAAMIAFIEEHHVERAHYKRKRNKADPEALAKGRLGPERDRILREQRDKEDGHGPS